MEKYQIIETERRIAWINYYNGFVQINALWSKIRNSKDFSGLDAKQLESMCYKNLELLRVYNIKERADLGHYEMPPSVPAYTRLAMLYEKQGKYKEALRVTEDALSVGAHCNGSMKKRKIRLYKKIKSLGGKDGNKSQLERIAK